MALGRKKQGGRKEPKFDGAASLDGVRLNPRDRIGGRDDDDAPPKRRAAKSRPLDDDEDDMPRERPRKTRAAERKESKSKARGRSRSGLGRLVYWGAVLGLWAIIAGAGVIIWVGAHLPAIQSLEIGLGERFRGSTTRHRCGANSRARQARTQEK